MACLTRSVVFREENPHGERGIAVDVPVTVDLLLVRLNWPGRAMSMTGRPVRRLPSPIVIAGVSWSAAWQWMMSGEPVDW